MQNNVSLCGIPSGINRFSWDLTNNQTSKDATTAIGSKIIRLAILYACVRLKVAIYINLFAIFEQLIGLVRVSLNLNE